MTFGFLHATLGWILAAFAAWALRHRSADARCWAWRLGLLKGPLALLLAIPIFYSPLSSGRVRREEGRKEYAAEVDRRPSSGGEGTGVRGHQPLISSTVPTSRSAASSPPESSPSRLPHKKTGGVDDSPQPPLSFSLFPLPYLLGLAAVLLARLVAARRSHRAMPRVVGVLRPRVVIPPGLTPEAAAMARAHEESHVRRRDPQWSFLAELVCAAFWFAPPVWLCARAMRRESESACDAAAVAATGVPRAAYARLLLAFAGPAPALALGGPARRLARRILMLERNPKPLPHLAVAALLAAGLALLLPWRAEARPPERRGTTRRPSRVSTPRYSLEDAFAHSIAGSKSGQPSKERLRRSVQEEMLRIRLNVLQTQIRALQAELDAMRGSRDHGFDPDGFRLIQKQAASARRAARAQALVAAELARKDAARGQNQQAFALAQARANAARSIELARKANLQATKAQADGMRQAQAAQRAAAEAVRRARSQRTSVVGGLRLDYAQEVEQRGGTITLRGNPVVNGTSLDGLPSPATPDEPIQVLGSEKGRGWKIFRVGDKPPYDYRVERSPASTLNDRTEKSVVPKDRIVPGSRRIGVSRWSLLSVGGLALAEGEYKTLRERDRSTWTLIRGKGSVAPNYRLEYRFEAPADEYPNHVFPKAPPATLTVDGVTWTIHPSANPTRAERIESIFHLDRKP